MATLTGFGIGSLLTPLLALRVELKLAVAAISIPHLVATAMRCWMLREHINRSVLRKFGLWSAVGGLVGAIFHEGAQAPLLLYIFSGLLIYVGASGLLGFSDRFEIPPRMAWLAGLLSGGLGGVVGNQGGVRSAALLGLDLTKMELVSTATAIGVIVDLARVPVYLAANGAALGALWLPILIASAGCALGTVLGKGVLIKLPEKTFRTTVHIVVLLLGINMLLSAGR